jgi:hypothetical protein
MSHYICTGGCRGVSDHPGYCQSNACPRHGLELKECSCEDHRHWGAFASQKPRPKTDQKLNPSALALTLGIFIGIITLLNGIVALVLYPDSDTTLTFISVLLSAGATAIAGIMAGAVIAWLYNALDNKLKK